MDKKGTLANLLSNMDDLSLAKTRNRLMLAAKISDAIRNSGKMPKEFAMMIGKNEMQLAELLSGNVNLTVDELTELEQVLKIRFLCVWCIYKIFEW